MVQDDILFTNPLAGKGLTMRKKTKEPTKSLKDLSHTTVFKFVKFYFLYWRNNLFYIKKLHDRHRKHS